MKESVYKPPTQAKYSSAAAQQIQPVAQRKSYLYSGSRNGAGSTTLYTVPAGKQARLVYWQLMSTVNTFAWLRINSDNIVVTYPGVTEYNTLFLGYDCAPILKEGDVVRLTVDLAGVGTIFGNIIITEEDLSSYS